MKITACNDNGTVFFASKERCRGALFASLPAASFLSIPRCLGIHTQTQMQMDLPILVKRTLASLMAHLGANTSSLLQARTDVLQSLSCKTHKVMLRNLLNDFAASIRIAARHHSRPDPLSHSSLCLWVHNWSVAVEIEN